MNVAYLILKTAHSLYGRNPGALDSAQRRQVERLARRQFALEARVLATPEARDTQVPPASVAAALEEICGRYADPAAFADDLAENGLSIESYRESLERELRVDATLESVARRAAPVGDIDVELYYHYHPEQFERPELRRARHILVTINPTLPDNTAEVARARIEAIARRLAKDPKRFEEQATKHSECPTALSGGLLGDVRPGQLFPELDRRLFELRPMEISPVLDSPLGLHLLRCDSVRPPGRIALDEVSERIRQLLTDRRKRICQQAWLKQSQGG